MRTLENKIADAGPNPQRVDPHLITQARNALVAEGLVTSTQRNGLHYFHMADAAPEPLAARIAEIGAVHDRTRTQTLTMRVGQTLEIAIYRALAGQPTLQFLGGFADLSEHDDSTLYSKEEPPSIFSGRPSHGRLDFLLVDSTVGPVGVEAKNIREWIYPDRSEVIDLIRKCCALDAVPVLIARRFSYATFSVLHPTGVILHQVYNQLYPEADAETAGLARDKYLLGYHDIRSGNAPDARLTKFVHSDLPALLPAARERFSEFKDLLEAFSSGGMGYQEFAGRLRRRERGEPEDGPAEWFEPD